jgi:predicted alpha/beta-fold hydrolase
MRILNLIIFLSLGSCQSLYFLPYKEYIWNPKLAGYEYTSHQIKSDNQKITIWEIRPKKIIKGSIIFFHGNAENISTHSQGMMWLVNEGYVVYAVDYRGYGESDGVANIDNAIEDIQLSFKWVLAQIPQNQKLIVFGQSLGASLTIYALKEEASNPRILLFVFDSAFSSYSKIVKEKLELVGILPPFRNLLSLIAYSGSDPIDVISEYPENKVLLVHNQDDPIVDFNHSEILFETMKKPNYFWWSESGGHTSYFSTIRRKNELLSLLDHIK